MSYPQTAGQSVPTPVRPVIGAHDELESNIAQLHDTIGALTERLASVLGSSKPQGVESSKGPPTAPTLANRIYSAASAVRSARERVGDLLDRLEL